jgi:hypothetical protein
VIYVLREDPGAGGEEADDVVASSRVDEHDAISRALTLLDVLWSPCTTHVTENIWLRGKFCYAAILQRGGVLTASLAEAFFFLMY